MATEISRLMGEVIENPVSQDKNIEELLRLFLKALLDEQKRKK